MFQWDPVSDAHEFRGLNNSFVLEDKIAKILGYDDPRQIYNDLFLRAKILRMMIDNDIVEYSKVNQVFFDFALKGVDGLPFVV